MNDPEIRVILRNSFSTDSVWIDELMLGTRKGSLTRADLVHLTPTGTLHGFELKGDNDTLKRVPLQLKCYGNTFSQLTFVVTAKHFRKLLLLIPAHVGIIRISRKGIPHRIRPPRSNPAQQKRWLGYLLWKVELKRFCKLHKIPVPARARILQLGATVHNHKATDVAVLESYVAACLLARLPLKLQRRSSVTALRMLLQNKVDC